MSPRQISVIGNTTALVLIVMMLMNEAVLFEVPSRDVSASQRGVASESTPSSRTLLIVIDGLRRDTAEDAQLMPMLAALRTRGAQAILQSTALVPSTLAAIIAFVEGRVAPPVSLFRDFGAPEAANGGVFEWLSLHGWSSYFSGPRLWDDLYGRWITDALAVDGFPDREADRMVENGGRQALSSRQDDYRLVVVHLSLLDEVAHRQGGSSEAYRAVAARHDAAIGRLVDTAGPQTNVLVVSDHGVTAAGGHAGPEPEVRLTPMVAAGPNLPTGDLGVLDQTRLPALLAGSLGVTFLSPNPIDVASRMWNQEETNRDSNAALSLITIVLVAGSALCVLATGSSIATNGEAIDSFWLAGAVWTSVFSAVFAAPAVGAAIGASVLCGVAARRALRVGLPFRTGLIQGVERTDGTDRFFNRSVTLFTSLVIGAGLALLQLIGNTNSTLSLWVDASLTTMLGAGIFISVRWRLDIASALNTLNRETVMHMPYALTGLTLLMVALLSAWLGGAWMLVTSLLGFAAAACLANARKPVIAGLALAMLLPVMERLTNSTLSLSTVDVSVAHQLIDSPFGLTAAVIVTIIRCALPALTVAAGWVIGYTFRSHGIRWSSEVHAQKQVLLVLGVTHVGASLVFGGCLVLVDTTTVEGSAWASLALGGLFRQFNAICWVFLGIGLAAYWQLKSSRSDPYRQTWLTRT